MMRNLLTLVCILLSMKLHAEDFRSLDPSGGHSRCVVVRDAHLIHTGQVHGVGPTELDFESQFVNSLHRVHSILEQAGAKTNRIARLNIYVARESDVNRVEPILSKSFDGSDKPTASLVVSKLPWTGALIAVDAIAASSQSQRGAAPQNTNGVGLTHATLNPGARVYISGQAEKGNGDLSDATHKTLESLQRTCEFLGLSQRDVVQVKCFLSPMAEFEKANSAIEKFFVGKIPPCVFVEWISALPIEIEMIVDASRVEALRDGPTVEVRTPPGMTTPTVYSRLSIARHPATIYTSGLYPTNATAGPETQLRSLFTNLKQSLDASGSDWMHLVKATYYVSDETLSKWHNTVRPDYFSPRRPPAASKAMVNHVGRDGHGIMMDFVAVPGE